MALDFSSPRPPRPPQPNLDVQVHNPFVIPAEIQGPAEKRGPTVEDRIRGIIQKMRQQPTPAGRPPEPQPQPEPKSVLIR